MLCMHQAQVVDLSIIVVYHPAYLHRVLAAVLDLHYMLTEFKKQSANKVCILFCSALSKGQHWTPVSAPGQKSSAQSP
jgi:hypothetical protein